MGFQSSCAYFISDAHLGINLAGYESREDDLIGFLNTVVSEADHLFIVGDLFDFWIEYKTTIRSCYFKILNALANLRNSGTDITYITGNHDFAVKSFLVDTLGIKVVHDHYSIRYQNKLLHFFHGDGIIAKDSGYRILRKILRNPLNQKLYQMLHPDFAIWLAELFSGSSRKYLADRLTESKIDEYKAAALQMLNNGDDLVIFGHTHRAQLWQMPNGKSFLNPGEWIKKYTYGTLAEGIPHIYRYISPYVSQEIEAKPF